MFLTLLLVTLLVAVIVSFIVVRLFKNPIDKILQRIISDEISTAWSRYLQFAIYVVGISNGVRIWQLERYISPESVGQNLPLQLNRDRWVLEVYRSVIETLEGIAWMLLIFFIFALIAYVIVRFTETRKKDPASS